MSIYVYDFYRTKRQQMFVSIIVNIGMVFNPICTIIFVILKHAKLT